ncbi:MAG TPA: ATP-binding protein [Syntrophorhabdaceae bacterium]|nr:ATP-binding protein [Syntrophorhabdaceae bacterium]
MKMMRYKKEIFVTGLVLFVFGFFIYLETQLPFFKKFLPVGENKLIIVILNINLLLILLLLFLITRTIIKNYIEKKRGIWGSRLKTKLTFTLLFISIIPSFTLFILSTSFFHISMERWFSQKIEDTLDNALEISEFYYNDLFQRYERINANISKDMIKLRSYEDDASEIKGFLKRQAMERSFQFYSVIDSFGNILYSNMPEGIDDILTSKLKSEKNWTIRLIMPLKQGEIVLSGTRLLDQGGTLKGAIFIGDMIRLPGTQRLKEISSVHKEFKESRTFKKILKYSFIIPLFLSTVITIFFSVWVGIKMAAGIITPIEKVKEGASIIARGKFDINLEEKGSDEIGTLVGAFNSMARELKIAKEELEEKRRYIEVILDNVATGIISTDNRGNIVLLNRAAKAILNIEGDEWIGKPLKKVFGSELKQIMKSFLKEVKAISENSSIVKEMRLKLKKDITFLRASLTVLKNEEGMVEGFIIAFDDITHFVRAEKLATWREIAKKLTHEIKNPLTPIILSAERIRRKILSHVLEKDREVLDETTSIIIKSVEEIKDIVNELTKLTHISKAKTMEDINSSIEEVIDIYNNLYPNIVFNFHASEVPLCRIDKDGLRRAIINLITNSAKAIGDKQGRIDITTGFEKKKGVAVIKIADNGRGVPDEDKDKVFDPYFTKDKDGTGLGLSIVQSIILEHHGKISIEDNKPEGACFIIEIPVLEA